MKTIQLLQDDNDKFSLDIEIQLNVRITKNLLAEDGTIKLEGKTLPYNFNSVADQADKAKQQRATLQSTVEDAFATYWTVINI